jgi:hypothetical protein
MFLVEFNFLKSKFNRLLRLKVVLRSFKISKDVNHIDIGKLLSSKRSIYSIPFINKRVT